MNFKAIYLFRNNIHHNFLMISIKIQKQLKREAKNEEKWFIYHHQKNSKNETEKKDFLSGKFMLQ